MVEIKIELDNLTSMLVSYHILCAPTEINKRYNQDIFNNLQVTSEERGYYLSYLLSKGIQLDKTDCIRTTLFYPEYKSLDDFFANPKKEIPEKIRKDILAFKTRFLPYLEKIREKINPLVELRIEESNKFIDKIYDLAQELSSVNIERPKELEVRIVEGIAPSSMGTNIIDGKGYIIEQTRNFLSKENSYLLTLIHEAVAHQTANDSRKYLREKFGRHVYDIEEGFAKLFSKKIAEKILSWDAEYSTQEGIQTLAYNTFNKNWDSLKGNDFENWYQKCLTEIKDESQK